MTRLPNHRTVGEVTGVIGGLCYIGAFAVLTAWIFTADGALSRLESLALGGSCRRLAASKSYRETGVAP